MVGGGNGEEGQGMGGEIRLMRALLSVSGICRIDLGGVDRIPIVC